MTLDQYTLIDMEIKIEDVYSRVALERERSIVNI